MTSNNSSNIEPLHPEAFEKLFKMVHKPLLRFIFRMCGDLNQAEDVVQDVFVRIWERKSEFENISHPKSYIYRAAINQVINAKRKQKFTSLEELFSEDHLEPSEDSLQEHINANDLQGTIEVALNALSEANRTVFLLSRQEEMSYKEIAATLGISVSTVEKHMLKSLHIMRKHLRPA